MWALQNGIEKKEMLYIEVKTKKRFVFVSLRAPNNPIKIELKISVFINKDK